MRRIDLFENNLYSIERCRKEKKIKDIKETNNSIKI